MNPHLAAWTVVAEIARRGPADREEEATLLDALGALAAALDLPQQAGAVRAVAEGMRHLEQLELHLEEALGAAQRDLALSPEEAPLP